MSFLISVVSFGWCVWLVYTLLWLLLFDRLHHIPGPPWAKCTTLWLSYQVYQGNFPQSLCSLHKEYGPAVRIGPNAVSLSTKAAVDTIYGFRRREFSKSRFYRAFDPGLGGSPNSFGMKYGHGPLKGHLQATYGSVPLHTHEVQLHKVVRQILRTVEAAVECGKNIDMMELCHT